MQTFFKGAIFFQLLLFFSILNKRIIFLLYKDIKNNNNYQRHIILFNIYNIPILFANNIMKGIYGTININKS